MKICVFLGPFLSIPPEATGAVEKIWHDLSLQFSDFGHSVKIVGKKLKSDDSARIEYLSDPGEVRSGNIGIDILRDVKYANRVSSYADGADIVITNSFSLPIILSNERKIRKQKYKIVVNIARMPKGQLFLYRNIDRFAVVSSAVQKIVRKQDDIAFRKSIVIENPIDCDTFNNIGRKEKEDGKRKILYVGRISREKGINILIDSFRMLSRNTKYSYTLKIVGPHRTVDGGDGQGYLEELKKSAQGMKIEFQSPVWNSQELGKLYKEADIFVYPSMAENGETFGVAPLEAMACGTVTVVSDLECFSQFVRDEKNALVARIVRQKTPENYLYEKILELEKNETYNLLQKNGIETAKEFGLKKIAEKYLRVFADLICKEKEI